MGNKKSPQQNAEGFQNVDPPGIERGGPPDVRVPGCDHLIRGKIRGPTWDRTRYLLIMSQLL